MATHASSRRLLANLLKKSNSFNGYIGVKSRRHLCSTRCLMQQDALKPEFGLLFDIDGVLIRGKKVLPSAREAIRLLTNGNREFWVPTIFVTNAGNTLRQSKAKQLSDWFGVKVQPDQMIMSHSPLRMFRQFHDKHVLVSGQGPLVDIAHGLGFTKVTTTDTLRYAFPQLDMVDHRRRKTAPCAFEKYFPRIEAVILFGEPVRWETNLQLIIDVLLTNGLPDHPPDVIPEKHIPVLACNMDLLWMAEAPMPRFAHGCFLHCLEGLYHKITGRELTYTALIGKPSELTYHYAEHVLSDQAKALGLESPRRLYCIGDNPETDIYGANLYQRHLHYKLANNFCALQNRRKRMSTLTMGGIEIEAEEEENADRILGAESCDSVLVSTGVYSSSRESAGKNAKLLLNHNHRDFSLDPDLTKPTMVAHNVYEALKKIFEKEGYR